MMKAKKTPIRELCRMSLFAAIIAVCAQVSIPMPYGVPMTLQTFAVPLAGLVLGMKNGTSAALIYIILGAAGVPVFAGFTGGPGIIFGRTGGFILSFPLMALTAGAGANKKNIQLILWLAAGAIINFACGMLMFSFVTSNNLIISFTYVVLPFIPTAVVKIIMAAVSGRLINRALVKAGVPVR